MSNMQLVKDFVEGSHLIGVIIDVLCRRQSQFVEKQLQAYNIQFKTFTLILHFWLKCLLGKCHCNKINVNILLIVFNVSILDKRRPKFCQEIITLHMHPIFCHSTCIAVSLWHLIHDVRHWCSRFSFVVQEGRVFYQTADIVFVALLVPTFTGETVVFLDIAIVVLFRVFI